MPVAGNDVGEEPLELLGIVDQLSVEMPQVPFEQDLADVEDDGLGSVRQP
jgi:hypothetical protein